MRGRCWEVPSAGRGVRFFLGQVSRDIEKAKEAVSADPLLARAVKNLLSGMCMAFFLLHERTDVCE